jgi:hypothetical protein
MAQIDRELNQLNFLKKQTWVITNYVVALHAGIYGIGRTSDHLLSFERSALVIAAILIGVVGAGFLINVQDDIRKVRVRIDKNDPAPYARGLSFVIAFIVVMVFSAALAIWSSLRSLYV